MATFMGHAYITINGVTYKVKCVSPPSMCVQDLSDYVLKKVNTHIQDAPCITGIINVLDSWCILEHFLGRLEAFKCIEAVTGQLEQSVDLLKAGYMFDYGIRQVRLRLAVERYNRGLNKE